MIHTEETLRKQDTELENFHYQLEDGEKYKLTSGEAHWVLFNRGKYAINDHMMQATKEDEEGNLIYEVDTYGMTEALNDDGMNCKAVMLSDDTVLQSIFFYSNNGDIIE